ncbi:tetratricopeptide repeat protein [Streptomyces sp. NBS 14/10]|uniref:tetratricopeptide repeat protein n=1 Tax=Streptomyces sp. NBS 14/10 TaxID=1945643 RepID=UPI000B7D93EC|nr:tetratricopeptide repeat protein [Streptomyces sp. NBS 14/10]KAK1182300.1 tetratricopeptide repeat protein [Streptomyces sp. NBS 14/10]
MGGRDGEGDGLGGDGHNAVYGGTVHGGLIQARLIEAMNLYQAPPPPPPVPRQVPPAPRGFVNREGKLADLHALVDRARSDPAPPVVVVSGLGGVGKTALVCRWAWQVVDQFPDGQLYTDLAAVRRDGGVDVGGVLGGFLRALGVHESYVPASLADRTAMFRSVTAGRRLLVVVDNAQHAAEVRPLAATGGMTVITSRTQLPGLVLDGAEDVEVEPLTQEAGTRLVRSWLSGPHGAETALAELVRMCGGLPLALRAVGARLVSSGRLSVDRVLAELADERQRLRRTDPASGDPAGGDPDAAGVGPVFDAVYETFPAHTRWLYHLLGVHPGPTFTESLARAVGGARVADALGDLLAAHMATRLDERGEWFRLHDLVRLHARERAETHESESVRTALLGRVVAYYRVAADAADRAAAGDRFRLPTAGAGNDGEEEAVRAAAPTFADRSEALEWLDTERTNLLPVLRAAAEHGWHDAVWRLCQSLWTLYHTRKHYGDWIESHRLGVEAAQWEGRVDAEVRMHNQLARAYYELKELDRAAEELARAGELLGLVSDPRLPGVIWETDGLLRLAHGRPLEALDLFQRAKEANEAAGDRHGVVVQSYNVGQALFHAGRYEQARTVLTEARGIVEETDDDPMRSRIGIVLGRVHRAEGAVDEAMSALADAVTWAARLGQHTKWEEALDQLIGLAAEAHDERLAEFCREQRQALLRTVRVTVDE